MTPQQNQQLIALLQGPDYTALNDADAATRASTPTFVPVPYTTFQTGVMQLPCWGLVRTASANLSQYPAPLQPVILTACDLFTNYRGATVDLSLPAFRQALGALNAAPPNGAGLVSDADKAAILALGQVLPVGVVVQAADVTAARAAIALQQAVAQTVARIEQGKSAALGLVNAWANGGAKPSNAQINAAFAGVVGS